MNRCRAHGRRLARKRPEAKRSTLATVIAVLVLGALTVSLLPDIKRYVRLSMM